MCLSLLDLDCSLLGLIFHTPELWNVFTGVIRLYLHHLQFLCVARSLTAWSSATRFLSTPDSSVVTLSFSAILSPIPFQESNLLFQCVDFLLSVHQMLTGLLLSFLRLLEFVMQPSEFLLRRTVFLVASILFDSSSFVL